MGLANEEKVEDKGVVGRFITLGDTAITASRHSDRTEEVGPPKDYF